MVVVVPLVRAKSLAGLGNQKRGVLSCFLGFSLQRLSTGGIGSCSVRSGPYYSWPRLSSVGAMGNVILYMKPFGGGHTAKTSSDELFLPAHEFITVGLLAEHKDHHRLQTKSAYAIPHIEIYPGITHREEGTHYGHLPARLVITNTRFSSNPQLPHPPR